MRFTQIKNFLFILCIFLFACSKSKRFAVSTNSPGDINASSVTFSGNAKNSDNTQVSEIGFCYSADKIPLYADKHVSAINNGTDIFKITVNDLAAKTNYNVRAYSKLKDGTIYYGNVITFSTNGNYQLGNKGPGGGIIFFIDEFNPSGKYFEAKTIVGNTFTFGCLGTYIGTGMHSGEGKLNTNEILGMCTGNTAASACVGLSVNGLADWCLPTIEDLEYLQGYYLNNNSTFSDRNFWSSSDYDQNFAYTFNFLTGDSEMREKSEKHEVIAIRYFN